MAEDFLAILEKRLADARDRHNRAYAEWQNSKSEIGHLAGLVEIERLRIKADENEEAEAISGPPDIRNFLLNALPTQDPGAALGTLVAQAEKARVPIEAGKSIARSINANLLSLQTLKAVRRSEGGGWVRLKETPQSGVFE